MGDRFYSMPYRRSTSAQGRGFYSGKNQWETNVAGLSDLDKALSDLPQKLHGNIMRGAIRAGLRVIQQEAKNRVPVRTGTLRDTIRVSVRLKKDGTIAGKLSAGSRVKGGSQMVGSKRGAFYAHMVEFGTAAHIIEPKNKSSGLFFGGFRHGAVRHPGAEPKAFMRPALAVAKDEAVAAVAEYIRARLDSIIK